MHDARENMTYQEKTTCFIGEDDNFERHDLDGLDYPVFSRKPINVNVANPGFVGPREPADKDIQFDFFLKSSSHQRLTYPLKSRMDIDGIEKLFQALSATQEEIERIKDEAVVNRLSIGAKPLGAVTLAIFGGLLLISFVTREMLVAPVIGWIGIIFGLSYFLMGFCKEAISEHRKHG